MKSSVLILIICSFFFLFNACENKGSEPDSETEAKYEIYASYLITESYYYCGLGELNIEIHRMDSSAPSLELADLEFNSNEIELSGNSEFASYSGFPSVEYNPNTQYYFALQVAGENSNALITSPGVNNIRITYPEDYAILEDDENLDLAWTFSGNDPNMFIINLYDEYRHAISETVPGYLTEFSINNSQLSPFDGRCLLEVIACNNTGWAGSASNNSYVSIGLTDSIPLYLGELINLDPPSGLQLMGASNELYLSISWTGSSTADIDGYRIYFDGGTTPIYEGMTTTYTHGSSSMAPQLGEYEIVAYRGDEESDALEFDTEDYVYSGSFTVYDLNAPSGGSTNSGVSFNISTGVASVKSMASSMSTTNGPLVDFYYDTDGTFTSADYLGGDWVNTTGFSSSSDTWAGLEVVDITGYDNYTNPAVANGQIWQVWVSKTSSSEWNYSKFRIDDVQTNTGTPDYLEAQVTYKFQTIKNWARID